MEARFNELKALGLNVKLVAIGNKGKQYFKRRPKFDVLSECCCLGRPVEQPAVAFGGICGGAPGTKLTCRKQHARAPPEGASSV